MKKLQENLKECSSLLKLATENNEDSIKIAAAYSGAYRARKNEIAERIEQERGTKPLLWIGLTFILTSILSATLVFLGSNYLGPNLVQLVPKLAQMAPELIQLGP